MAKDAEIIAEIFGQVGAGGDIDGATIFVNIGKWWRGVSFARGREYFIFAIDKINNKQL